MSIQHNHLHFSMLINWLIIIIKMFLDSYFSHFFLHIFLVTFLFTIYLFPIDLSFLYSVPFVSKDIFVGISTVSLNFFVPVAGYVDS